MPSPARTSLKSARSSTIVSRTPHEVERLLIVRLGAMGDVIHGLPAVAALRAAFPEATAGLADRRALGGIAVHACPRLAPARVRRSVRWWTGSTP